ncbi:phage baseplate plug family protein [Paenibacillus tyrfis]|uniref:Cyanophage baseplate Pam3 plug gp18 domain-containing protein n=1 Tax=Paenibacillus tyrfis TaxID=1501230 RepID=A0A081NWQ7_9BACL|nr:hypothetical protein [Paenibacillus tyrfis]KEQ22880.1 hypothetical protein ET33_21285 [Paenibacillus tyrfis]
MEYIDIEKQLIPYRFEISLSGTVFTFEVHYNSEFDFFTVDLERDGEVLVTGEKLIYGVPLFVDSADERFPKVMIIPFDESGNSDRVTWDSMSENVFLFIGGVEDG